MTAGDLDTAKAYARRERLSAEVRIVPWPACDAMLALGPAIDDADRPLVRVSGGETRLRIGEPLLLTVTAPSFAAFMYVFYLQADGTVVNLLPRTDILREQQRPRWSRTFGDGSGGLPKFKVSPPKGHEAVVAIAARTPIAELEALERAGRPYRLQLAPGSGTNESRAFLTVLRRGLAGLAKTTDSLGAPFTANVLPLEIGD